VGNHDEGQERNCPCALRYSPIAASCGCTGIREENPEDAASGDRTLPQTRRGGQMSKKLISADELHRRWLKDPKYQQAYESLEEEFRLASALIAARTRAGLTQEELAQRMHTKQAVIARLESGRVKPSTRTLERIAKATGHRLRISFERE